MPLQFEYLIRDVRKFCWTWTEDHVLDLLCQYAARSKVIVECGTYFGASAFAMMCAAPREAHMWCIDKFEVAGTEFVARRNLEKWIEESRLEIIVGDSERGGSMLQHMIGKVDLIFVDDGHSEEDVKRDIRCLKPLLRPGGVMLGHDFDGDNDVARGVYQSSIPFDVPTPRVWRYEAR